MKRKSPIGLLVIVAVLIGLLVAVSQYVKVHTPVDEDEAEHAAAGH